MLQNYAEIAQSVIPYFRKYLPLFRIWRIVRKKRKGALTDTEHLYVVCSLSENGAKALLRSVSLLQSAQRLLFAHNPKDVAQAQTIGHAHH